jgi:hypothetical protein
MSHQANDQKIVETLKSVEQPKKGSGCFASIVLICGALLFGNALCLAAKGAELRGPSGHGLLQAGDRQWQLKDSEVNHPKLDFFVLRDRWHYQEPRDDVFNFTYNAPSIRRIRKAGKQYIIATMCGVEGSPKHIPGQRYKGGLVPWAPAIPREWGKFIYALANTEVDGIKLKDDPAACAVWCTGPTVSSQEMHISGSNVNMSKAPGYSRDGIVRNYNECIDLTRAAFPNTPGILSISVQNETRKYQDRILNHFLSVYGSQANVQHNSFNKDTNLAAPHHKLLLDLKKKGTRIGAEMAWPGHAKYLTRFPQRDYMVLYRGDEKQLP